MLEFSVREVWHSWNELWPGSVPDAVDFTVRADETGDVRSYGSVDHFVQVYECAVAEIPTSEHPMNELTRLKIAESNSSVTLTVIGYEINTSYEELKEALEPFLSDVFEQIDDRTEDVAEDPERVKEFTERINTRWPLLFDFSDLHDQLTTTGTFHQ